MLNWRECKGVEPSAHAVQKVIKTQQYRQAQLVDIQADEIVTGLKTKL